MTEAKTAILVVDDEEHVRTLLKRILEQVGYSVATVTTGSEALDRLQTANFDLVLLDIRMPSMDGFQTLPLIREITSIPVMMVTGLGEVSSVTNALGLGADDYITKPFNSEVLLARIEAKVRHRNKQD